MPAKILVVEDEPILQEILEEFLSENGYVVSVASDASEGLNMAYEQNFDLWILDVKLPKGDGFSLLKNLRERKKDTPTIFTTSLNSIQDLEQGYLSGCDDYLKKPFELQELLIRIKALLKRRFSHRQEEFIELGGGFRFSIEGKMLFLGDELYALSAKELELLSLFLQNKNRLLSHEEICDKLWQYDETPSDMSLRVYIKNLRRILGKDKIINSRGEGYIYVA